MGVLTAREIRSLKAPDMEQAVRDVAAQLAANEQERVRLEEARRRLFIRGGEVGVSQRQMAPWAGITNSRINQIVTAESPAKKAAAKKAATRKPKPTQPVEPAVPTPA